MRETGNLKMTILTEENNHRTQDIDLKNGYEIAKLINFEDQKVADAIQKELKKVGEAIDLIAESFFAGGRLAYFGAGTSGRIGVLDASECVPTFGVEAELVKAYIAGGDRALRYSVENAEDDAMLGLKDLEDFAPQKNDVVVGVSASGNPKYVLAVLEKAQKAGVHTIALSSNVEAKMKAFADIFICPVVGPEVIAGSSRMKAGTAQKMVLNMLSTGAMIKIGKTYHNYMVDLKISNNKLFERGCRLVREICGISQDEAENILKRAGNRVKTACVMKLKNYTREAAEEELSNVGGVLRKIIG